MQIGHKYLLARSQGMAHNVICLDLSRGHRQEYADAICVDVRLEGQQLGVYDVTCTSCSALLAVFHGPIGPTLLVDGILWDGS